MRQIELHLSDEDSVVIDEIRAKGIHNSREVNKAQPLSYPDKGIPESHHGCAGNRSHSSVARQSCVLASQDEFGSVRRGALGPP